MKGVVRIAVLLCSYLAIQRWLLLIGLGLIAAGQIFCFADPRAAIQFGGPAVLMGLALLFMAVALPLGPTLRSISAPRTLLLIPDARVRSLLASALVVLALAAFVTGNIILLTPRLPSNVWGRMRPDTLFVWALDAEMVATLYFFCLTGRSAGGLLAVIAIGGVVGVERLWPLLKAHIAASGMSPSELLLLLTAGAWSVFAFWYLSARSISLTSWDRRTGGRLTPDRDLATSVSGSKVETRIGLSRAAAMRVQLLGVYSTAPIAKALLVPCLFVAVLFFAVLVGIVEGRHPAGRLPANFTGVYLFFLFFTFTIAVGLSTAAAAWVIARRSRLLWLQSGCTRNELFDVCERLAWRCLGVIGAPMGVLCVAAWICLPHPAGDWPRLPVAALAPCVCALYVGLMNVQGWRFIDVVAAVLTILLGLGSFMATPRPPHAVLAPWVFAAAGALAAIGLRALAQRRWRRIDWLVCKPQRYPSGLLRPVA